MILKDFLEQIRHTEITGNVRGNAVRTFELGQPSTVYDRFSIESFDGNKIVKQKFMKMEAITDNLLQAKLIKWNIILDQQTNGFDSTTIEFIVSF
jgi:hypothetical protein